VALSSENAIALGPGAFAGTFDAALGQWVFEHPTLGPLYLDDAAKKTIEFFLGFEPESDKPKVVFLAGPVKAGKSLWLNYGIPGLLLAQAASNPSAKTPVFIAHIATSGVSINSYFTALARQIILVASKFGAVFAIDPQNDIINQMTIIIKEFCDILSVQSRELYLLLDEIQFPVMGSAFKGEIPAYVQQYGDAFKSFATKGARIVATGSGMATALNAMRLAHTNGFIFLTPDRVISLGQPAVTNQAALQMCRAAAVMTKQPLADDTVVNVFSAVQNETIFVGYEQSPPRLALVMAVIHQMGTVNNFSLPAAIKAVSSKLKQESLSDMDKLIQLLVSQRIHRNDQTESSDIRKLALLAYDPPLFNYKKTELSVELRPLAWHDTSSPLAVKGLLPPYDSFARDLLKNTGGMQQVLLAEYDADCVEQLRFLNYVRQWVDKDVLKQISAKVMELLCAHKLIKKTVIKTTDDANEAIFFHDLVTLANKYRIGAEIPSLAGQLKNALANPTTTKSQETLQMVGFNMIAMIRHVFYHYHADTLPSDMVNLQRLSPFILRDIQQCAYNVLYHADIKHMVFIKSLPAGAKKKALVESKGNYLRIIKDEAGLFRQPQILMSLPDKVGSSDFKTASTPFKITKSSKSKH